MKNLRRRKGLTLSDNRDDGWRDKLPEIKHSVLREGATERPFTGKLLRKKDKGIYLCGACDAELFRSEHKFDSGSGWPSFYDVVAGEAVDLRPDNSHGMRRTEVICRNCRSHLGHLFEDAPQTPTSMRYCINSLALSFKDEQNNVTEG